MSARIKAIYSLDKAMQLEQEQALKTHLQAIAKILNVPQVLAHRCAYLNGLIGSPFPTT